MPTNDEKQEVWQAYHERRPTRVPVTLGANPRTVLFNKDWNPKGISFEELREGQKVTYVEGNGPNGPRAEQVTPVDA